jgi:DNA-directed RNA polymerase specialized sigma subunit
MKEENPEALWSDWKRTRNRQTLSQLVRAMRTPVDAAVKANPKLSPALIRAKAKRLMIEAFESYDPAQGTALKTHVTNHLKPLVARGHTMARGMSRSRYYEDIARDVFNFMRDYEETNGYPPTLDLVSDTLHIPFKTVKKVLSAPSYEFAEGAMEHGTSMVGDEAADQDRVNFEFWVDTIYNDELGDEDKRIMDMRMGRIGGKPMGVTEIARRLRKSPAYVSDRSNKIADKIVKAVNSTAKTPITPSSFMPDDEDAIVNPEDLVHPPEPAEAGVEPTAQAMP